MADEDEGHQAALAAAAQRRAEAAARGEITRTTPPRTSWTGDAEVQKRNRWDGNLTSDTIPDSMIDNWGSTAEPATTAAGDSPAAVAPAAEQPSADGHAGQDSDGR